MPIDILMAKTKPLAFEQALAELTTIVASMERGELSLEHALKQFERGVTLTRDCQQAISQAEQQVAILIDQTELKTFDEHDLPDQN